MTPHTLSWDYPSPGDPRQPPPYPPFTTGLAALDALTGGLDGIMVLASARACPREFLALSLVLGALDRNARLGAVIGAGGKKADDYHLATAAMLSGVSHDRIREKNLAPHELSDVDRAWRTFSTGVGRRLRIVESPRMERDGEYRGVPLSYIPILEERDRLLCGGEVDRCLVVVDDLGRKGVVTNGVPASTNDVVQPPPPPTDIEVDRAAFKVALDLWWLMSRLSDGWPDPVLAVADVRCANPCDISPADVRGWADANFIGRLQWSPDEYGLCNSTRSMNLDFIADPWRRQRRIPLLYEFSTCRFHGDGPGR